MVIWISVELCLLITIYLITEIIKNIVSIYKDIKYLKNQNISKKVKLEE